MKPIVYFLILSLPFTFSSCGKKEAAEEKPPVKEKPKKKHAYDWTPETPELVAGKKIYLQECASCHDEGEEGAPRLAKAKAWKEREAQGLDVLTNHAINGFTGDDGEMPARGGTPSLSDEEVINAVKFILATPKT